MNRNPSEFYRIIYRNIFMLTVFLFVLGFILWYAYYGAECAINGGTIMRNPWTMHFPLLWEEFVWALPFIGPERKVDYIFEIYGDDVMKICPYCAARNMLPGRLHFVLTHILIPCIPYLIYKAFTIGV